MTDLTRQLALVARETKHSGGCTFNVDGNIYSDGSGYVVSPFPYWTSIVELKTGLASELFAAIKTYYRYNRDTVEIHSDRYFGTWIHEGKLYLDIVVIEQELSVALDLGYDNRQQAIFDLSRMQDISCERSYGFAVVPNRLGDLTLYRAYVNADGYVQYDMRIPSVYFQSDTDKDAIRRSLSGPDCQELHKGWDVFVGDDTMYGQLLSEYFGSES